MRRRNNDGIFVLLVGLVAAIVGGLIFLVAAILRTIFFLGPAGSSKATNLPQGESAPGIQEAETIQSSAPQLASPPTEITLGPPSEPKRAADFIETEAVANGVSLWARFYIDGDGGIVGRTLMIKNRRLAPKSGPRVEMKVIRCGTLRTRAAVEALMAEFVVEAKEMLGLSSPPRTKRTADSTTKPRTVPTQTKVNEPVMAPTPESHGSEEVFAEAPLAPPPKVPTAKALKVYMGKLMSAGRQTREGPRGVYKQYGIMLVDGRGIPCPVYGNDLKRCVTDAGAVPGDTVRVSLIGQQEVSVRNEGASDESRTVQKKNIYQIDVIAKGMQHDA